MSLSNDITLYEDCRVHFDQALSAERGKRIQGMTRGEAIHFRQRMYKFRILAMRESTTMHSPGDADYAKTPYDRMSVNVIDTGEVNEDGKPLVVVEIVQKRALVEEEL